MNTKLKVAGLILIAGAAITGQAQARDPVVGALFGAGAGAVIGAAIGGHEGAAVGGIIGAVAGATLSNSRVAGVNSVGHPPAGQHAGGYVLTHGPAHGQVGVYQETYGYRGGYRNDGYRGDQGYDRNRGYRANHGYYGNGSGYAHGSPPRVIQYPAPVVVVPGRGYYQVPAPVIVAPPPRFVYGQPYPHYHRHRVH